MGLLTQGHEKSNYHPMFESIACLITEMLAYSQGKCHIRDQSSGKGNIMQTTLVFIPGLLLTADLYAHQTDALKGEYSIHHAETRGMDTITAMAERALDETSGKILPIGLSMGGIIALEIARIGKDRLSGLVVMDSTAGADTEARRAERIKEIKILTSLMQNPEARVKFKGITTQLLPRFIAPQFLDDTVLTKRIMDMAAVIGQDNFILQQTALLNRHEQLDMLKNFDLPSMFLVGALDSLTPPPLAQTMAETAPNSRYVEIPDVGHLPPMEDPEAVTKALKDFLDEITV